MPDLPTSFVPDQGPMPASFMPDEGPLPKSFIPDKLPKSFIPDEPSFLSRVATFFKPAITPIPQLEQAKEAIVSRIPGISLEQLPPVSAEGPFGTALETAKAATLPILQTLSPKAAAESQIPTTPLGISGTVAALPFGRLMRGVKAAGAVSKAAEPALTVEQTVGHLKELARATQGPEPVIKIVSGSTPKETMVNLLERQARPRLSSEQSLLGLKQTTEATRSIADEAINNIEQGKPIALKQGQQISEAVAEAVGNGEIVPDEAARILGMQAKADPAEMAQNIINMKSFQGSSLAQWSRVARSYKNLFDKNPEVANILKDVSPEPTATATVVDYFRRFENVRRALLVSQVATSVRNAVSQVGRYSLNVLEDAMSGVLGSMTGKIPVARAFDDAAEDVIQFFRALGQPQMQEMNNLLEKFPVQQVRLFRTPIGDVSIDDKVANFLNTLNTMQETFFRRGAFDARLRQSLGRLGVSINDAANIPEAAVKDAVNHALDLTFANSPVSGPGKALLNLYHEVPILTAIVNPFPRFWLNSMKFLHDFSPIPLFKPSTYTALASNDPRIAFQALNRSAIGTSMIGAAMALDQADFTGEKWYELKVGDKVYDMRPYNPFTTHLFIGRLLSRLSKEGTNAFLKLSSNDWTQAFVSMRRTDLAGVPILDAIDRGSVEGFKDGVLRFMGDYMGGFTTPFKVAKDVVGQFVREERMPRNIRERPFLGPTMANIPFLDRQLPIRPSPFRAEPEEILNPLMRQMTGLTARLKTDAEIESERLNIKPADIYPRTGSKEFDRLIVGKMGPLLENTLKDLISGREYLKSDDKTKKFLFKHIVGEFRSASKDIVRGERPDLAMEEFVKHSDEFIREELEKELKESAEP